MKLIKHSSASPDAIVIQQEYQAGVPGFWVQDKNGNTHKLTDGDYIAIDDDDRVTYFPAATIDNLALQQVKENLGREALRNIWKALADSGLTNTVKASILQTISPVLVACLAGEVQAARLIANATATTADYTAPRKAALLAILDEAIAKL